MHLNFCCYFRWWNCVLRWEVFQRQVPGQLFHQREASVPTLGPHGQGECVRHRWSQVWSCSPHSPMAQARRLQNWYSMFKRFFFLYFRLKPVNWLKNRAIFAGLGCSVHIASHKYLIIYSGLAKIPKFRKYLSIKFHGFMILKIEMFIYYFIYKQYLSCYMYQLMKCLYDV